MYDNLPQKCKGQKGIIFGKQMLNISEESCDVFVGVVARSDCFVTSEVALRSTTVI